MTTTTANSADRAALLSRLQSGAVAGLIAGVAFAMLAMLYGAVDGPGFWAPPRMIATTIGVSMAPTFAAGPVIAGLMVHMMLSAAYGAGYAVVAGRMRGLAALASGAAFGLALYLVNFELFARLEHFSVFRMMAGNWFEIADHVAFGVIVAGLLLLAPGRAQQD